MRYSPDQKSKSKQSILKLAGARLKKDGFAGIGVDGLASAAGVTSGAFYSNFSGKEDFLKEMINGFLGEPYLSSNAETLEGRKDELKDFLEGYLDVSHCANPEEGCVMPTLSADVSRASKSVRSVYHQKMLRLIDKVSKVTSGTSAKKRKRAWSVVSIMIGAVTIARALPESTEREEVMSSALETALDLVGE
jgi:TetR/AcrR family transcriptional repressor of nem operon